MPDPAGRLLWCGRTLAPRTGTELASMFLDGGTPHVLAPFSPRRFGA